MLISNSVRFWLNLSFLIPSILCSIFVLYHYLADRALRTALHNHVIIVIIVFNLITELTDMVWFTHFYRTGVSLISTPAFCLTWIFIDFALGVMVLDLVAWASIERHILIFHTNLVSTQRKRFIFHYFPLIFICIYALAFYAYVFLIQSCGTIYNYSRSKCGQPSCFYTDPYLGLWDSIINNVIPTFIIVIFTAALFVRVLYQKYRIHRQVRWKNYRKMALQLLSISTIYLALCFPFVLVYLAYTSGLMAYIDPDYYSNTIYFAYFTVIAIPFVCAAYLPGLKGKCKRIIIFWHRSQPNNGQETIGMKRQTIGRTATVVPVG